MPNRSKPLLNILVTASVLALPVMASPLTAVDLGQLRISQRPCWLNERKQTCVITVVARSQVMRIDFSAGDRPFWVFTPTGKGKWHYLYMVMDAGAVELWRLKYMIANAASWPQG
jgi:hypothetical protein